MYMFYMFVTNSGYMVMYPSGISLGLSTELPNPHCADVSTVHYLDGNTLTMTFSANVMAVIFRTIFHSLSFGVRVEQALSVSASHTKRW